MGINFQQASGTSSKLGARQHPIFTAGLIYIARIPCSYVCDQHQSRACGDTSKYVFLPDQIHRHLDPCLCLLDPINMFDNTEELVTKQRLETLLSMFKYDHLPSNYS